MKREKREVGAFEAKTHLPRLLDAVEHGARITITRRGEAVAELIPVQRHSKGETRAVIAEFRKWRKEQGITWGKGMSIQEARKMGRR